MYALVFMHAILTERFVILISSGFKKALNVSQSKETHFEIISTPET